MQRKIKVSNNYHLAGIPARILRDLPWIDYSEGTPTENTLKLENGTVDLALIPVVDYLSAPDYLCLDFGMGCRQRSDSMMLYATSPIHTLSKIHIYECSRTSELLLKILLAEVWRATPLIVRQNRHDLLDLIDETSGVLMMHDIPVSPALNLPIQEDLVSVWYRLTKLPMLFLIWAFKDGSLAPDELVEITKILAKGDKIKSKLAIYLAPEYKVDETIALKFVGDNRRYYIDEFMQNGFECFVNKANKLGLLTSSELRKAKIKLTQKLA